MARLRLTLLGGFQARLDSGPSLALPTRKSQALLAYLALPVGRAHPRDTLAALLWGGVRQESARAGLRQALFSIRKALGDADGALRQEGDTLALEPAAVDLDTASFERLVSAGTPEALAAGGAALRGRPPEWLRPRRDALRRVAPRGAGAAPGAGAGGAGPAAGTPAEGRRPGGGGANCGQASRPRPSPGARASNADAPLCRSRPAGRGAPPVPAVHVRAPAGAPDRAGGRDDAPLSGDPPPTPRAARRRRDVSRSPARSSATRAPRTTCRCRRPR